MFQELGFAHSSASDLLTAEISHTSSSKKIFELIVKNGTIMPPEVTYALLEEAVNRQTGNLNGGYRDGRNPSDYCNNFLIIDFPRNENNIEG